MKTTQRIVVLVVILLISGTASMVKGQDVTFNTVTKEQQDRLDRTRLELTKVSIKLAKKILKEIKRDQKFFTQVLKELDKIRVKYPDAPAPDVSIVVEAGWVNNLIFEKNCLELEGAYWLLEQGKGKVKLRSLLDTIYMERTKHILLLSAVKQFPASPPTIIN